MAKKNLIIDTNVFLSDSECFEKFENNDLFVPIKVLEELDKHKTRQDSVGFHARQSIKRFDALRASGSLSKGVRLGKGLGVLRFVKAEELAVEKLPQGLSHKSSDNLSLLRLSQSKDNIQSARPSWCLKMLTCESSLMLLVFSQRTTSHLKWYLLETLSIKAL